MIELWILVNTGFVSLVGEWLIDLGVVILHIVVYQKLKIITICHNEKRDSSENPITGKLSS